MKIVIKDSEKFIKEVIDLTDRVDNEEVELLDSYNLLVDSIVESNNLEQLEAELNKICKDKKS